jgi:hypothetical protein
VPILTRTPILPLPLNDLPLRLEDRLHADALDTLKELLLTFYQAQAFLAALPPPIRDRPQQAAIEAAPAPPQYRALSRGRRRGSCW